MANTPIQNPSAWVSILTRFGITGIARWFLSDTVLPVALVDSSVPITAIASTPIFTVPFSAGEQIAPPVNTRLADTGPLPAGTYSFVAWMSAGENNSLRLQRLLADNATAAWSQRFFVGSPVIVGARCVVAVNERIIITNAVVGGAGIAYSANILLAAG